MRLFEEISSQSIGEYDKLHYRVQEMEIWKRGGEGWRHLNVFWPSKNDSTEPIEMKRTRAIGIT